MVELGVVQSARCSTISSACSASYTGCCNNTPISLALQVMHQSAVTSTNTTWPALTCSVIAACSNGCHGWLSGRLKRPLPTVVSKTAAVITGIPVERVTASTLARSEEHTSELQSRGHLVCRLLLEKKKNKKKCTGV